MDSKKGKARSTALALVVLSLVALLFYEQSNFAFVNPVYWSLYTFVGGYLLCVGLMVLTFVRGRPGVLSKGWMIVTVVTALAFPLLSPLLYDEHRLYAKPASGYQMQWVTQPGSRIGNALKAAQRQHESSWCRYTLHGWSNENELYYGSSCQFGYWRYDPATGEKQWVISIPEQVSGDSVVDEAHVSVGQGMMAEHLPGFSSATEYPVIVYYIGVWTNATERTA